MFYRALLCFLFLVPAYSIAQTREFEHFSDEHGLISSHVTAVLKDTEGFIWIGTKQGLDRYDGYNCRHFVNDPSNSLSLPENHVKCLFDDGKGKIYVGFYGRGFSIYDKKTEQFEDHTFEEQLENVVRHDTVFAFCAGKDGSIWMGTNKGIDKYDPEKRLSTHYDPFEGFARREVTSIVDNGDGNLWLYGFANRPCLWNTSKLSREFLPIDSLLQGTVSAHGGAILLSRDQELWFGHEREGLCKYNLNSGVWEKFHLQNGFLKSDIINCLTQDSDGNIWVGTEGAGLYKYDVRKRDFEKFQYIANLPKNLRSNNISCLYESHPGILWIGSTTYGLSIWKRDKIKFEKFGTKGEEDKKLNSQSVLSISAAPEKKVWIGTDGGGLNLFDPKTNTFRYYTQENSPLCNNSIKSIYIDEKGTMWYGTFELGLCNVNLTTGAASTFQKELIGDEKKGIANCAWTLCRSHDNKLWIGLLQGGIRIYDLSSRKFVDGLNQSEEFKKLISLRIQVILEDSRRRIWIGTENFGIICYYPKSGHYIQFAPDEENPNSIKSKNVKTVFEDRDGNMWFGMHKGGLSKLINLRKKSFVTYTMADGLPNNNVKDIVEDRHGNFWLGTEKGISCFYRKEHLFRNFDMEDGLQGSNFHSNSNFTDKDGRIYMGGIDGFNIFHPDSLRFDRLPPPVVVTDLKIFDQSLDPNHRLKGNRYLSQSVSYTQELSLKHSDNVFSIEFAALDFQSPQKNRYAYKLEGFNEKWTYVDSDHRVASYTNLDPGEYMFHVIASNGDGVWNKTGIKLRIEITPPFYLTWWFRVFLVLFILGCLASFYFWRTRSIRQRNLLLRQEVENQTKKLREVNEELQLASVEVTKQAFELRQTNEKLQQTAEELANQNRKSLELYEELTESLEAAKLVQNAILPGKELLEKAYGQIDILYKPKDRVSGDFYWYTKMGTFDVLAVVDCTGHGVAGAFMSFVGYEILNQISKLEIKPDPGLVISLLNQEILNSMNHYESGTTNMGMDVSLCMLDSKTHTLYFAGANNPLYIQRDGEILQFKGDRQGIGGRQKNENYSFKTISIDLQNNDQMYLFSDGYPDQLGGEKGDEKFMYSRFRQLLIELRHLDVKKRIHFLGETFEDWRKDKEQLDDVLVIGFEYVLNERMK
jgi:ligand-binding sensor domain-containing protein/serine phosphatase RsbU (regulator of sigma subunit)